MIYTEYIDCLFAFRDAFGMDEDRPTWREIGHMTEAAVLAAIAKVKGDPRTKFYTGVTIAALVVRAAMPKRRGRRQQPVYRRRGA